MDRSLCNKEMGPGGYFHLPLFLRTIKIALKSPSYHSKETKLGSFGVWLIWLNCSQFVRYQNALLLAPFRQAIMGSLR